MSGMPDKGAATLSTHSVDGHASYLKHRWRGKLAAPAGRPGPRGAPVHHGASNVSALRNFMDGRWRCGRRRGSCLG